MKRTLIGTVTNLAGPDGRPIGQFGLLPVEVPLLSLMGSQQQSHPDCSHGRVARDLPERCSTALNALAQTKYQELLAAHPARVAVDHRVEQLLAGQGFLA